MDLRKNLFSVPRRARSLGFAICYLLSAICYPRSVGAGDILRGGSSNSSTGPTSAAVGGNQAAMAQLKTNAKDILARATQALQSAQAMQQTARKLALAAPNNVPNGLKPGGLQVATGKNAFWQGANQPTQSVVNGQTTVTILQTAPQAILNWQTFNVGSNTTAYFNQSAGGNFANTWVALNRILDPSRAPSQILGSIKAQGQVYLINQNGIIFGGSSQVNVSSLLVAAAIITNNQFTTSGIYSPIVTGVYQPSFTGGSGPVLIQSGAEITTNAPPGIADRGGSVILLGHSVENDGSITTTNGQTLLAAGKSFNLLQGYSITPANSSSGNLTSTTLGTEVAVSQGGIAVNTGLIQATTGDITMVGSQVTQGGVAISTSSVSQRGTIHLLTPTVDLNSGKTFPGSSVTLAPGSVTLIEPDPNSGNALNPQRTAAYAQQLAYLTNAQLNATAGLNDDVSLPDRIGISRIEITTGGTVDFASGSLTSATAGQIAVSAGKQVFAGTGAELNVSGLVDVSLPMSANNLAVSIQGFELRDNPLNRDSKTLFNSTVYVDLGQLQQVPASSAYRQNRFYTAGGALEVSGELNNVNHSINEWSTIGGSITLSAGQVVAQSGSVFNIAGGSIQYQAGYLKQSYLIGSDGHIYNVNTAPAGISYLGVFQGFIVNHPRWNVTENFANIIVDPSQIYRPGYTVGRDAGSLTINAPTSIFEGTIEAGTIDGIRQNGTRPSSVPDPFLLPQTTVPLNGSLTVGTNYPQKPQPASQPIAVSTSNVVFANGNTSIATNLNPTAQLDPALLDTNTFSAQRISSAALGGLTVNVQAPVHPSTIPGKTNQGYLTISAPLLFADGAQVSLTAANVVISGGITAPSGSVTINALSYQVSPIIVTSFTIPRPIAGITLEPGAVINTQGLFTNALLDPSDLTGEAFINGGNVTLATNQGITLAAGSLIDASSGAAILPNRKTLNGAGGNITILADQVGNVIARPSKNPNVVLTPDVAHQVSSAPLILYGTLRSFGVKTDGALSLQAYSVVIGDSISPAASSQLVLSTSFFIQGFSSYTINGLTSLTVAPGANINVTSPVYQITPAVFKMPTGTDPAIALGRPTLMPVYVGNAATATVTQRPGASLTLESGINPAIRPKTTAIDPSTIIDLQEGAFGGNIEIGLGASIVVDPNQSVTLQSGGQITVNGAIRAPAGTIAIANNRQLGGLGKTYNPGALSIWLGSNSVLDVAGNAYTTKDQFGRTYGVVQNGGSIILGSQGGVDSMFFSELSTDAFVIIRPGALLDVSGASAVLDPLAGTAPGMFDSSQLSGVPTAPVLVASNGGSITLSSYDGIFNDGTMRAFAGGRGAAGGTLSVILESPVYTLNKNQISGPQETQIPAVPATLNVPRIMTVGQGTPTDPLPIILQPGQTDPDLQVGQAYVSANAINQGGFANVSLYAGNQIAFAGSSILRAPESITLTALNLVGSKRGASTQIIAPYVKFSSPVTFVPISGGSPPFYSLELGVSNSVVVVKNFAVVADLIDFQGATDVGLPSNYPNFLLPQKSEVSFFSSGDIRFVAPVPNGTGGSPSSSVAAPDSISLSAAQIYPATGVSGSISAADTISIGRTGGPAPAVPYSVFGTLSLTAATIEQAGVLRAPLGSIVLTANRAPSVRDSGSVDLLPGSITSVSANGLTIPYGGTTDGVRYTVNGNSVTFPSLVGNANSISPSAGQFVIGITINALSVAGSKGSLIDLSGGGTLTGAGFISGRGGSVDVLSTPLINQNPTNTFSTAGSTVYAILPGGPDYAPSGASTNIPYTGGVPGIGQQITIPAGVPGLAPGVYTLLPSNYALLPGAYRVELGGAAAPLNQLPVIPVTGGSFLVTAYGGIANTGIQSSQPLRAIITSGTTVRDDSQYDEESYSSFALAQAAQFHNVAPLLPADAKTLVLNFAVPTARLSALTFNGAANFSPGPGGVSGSLLVEIPTLDSFNTPLRTNLLEITGQGAIPTRGWVSVSAAALDAFGAPNLFIGSVLAPSSGSSIVVVEATAYQVTLRAGAALTGAQVILAATQGGVTLETGSTITTLRGGSPGIDSSAGYLFTNGELAPAAVDELGYSVVSVSNGSFLLTPTAVSSKAHMFGGPVNINAGASIYSEGSIGFASGTSLNLSEQVNLGSRLIGFAVADINIGTDTALAAGILPSGLSFGQVLLDRLIAGNPAVGAPGLETLVFSASQSVNFYGSIDLAAPHLQLVFGTPAFYGGGTSKDSVTITANQVVWNGLLGFVADSSGNVIPVNTNPGPVIPGGPGTGAGTLNIVANQIVFGYSATDQPQNQIELSRLALGFSDVTFTARQEITANNKGSVSVYLAQTTGPGSYTGGNLTLVTPLLTGTPGSVLSYKTGGNLTLTTPAGVLPTTVMPDSLGAEINLTGNTITDSTSIMAASGKVTLTATGSINLTGGSRIDVSGLTVAMFDQKVPTFGGDVSLESTQGNITQTALSVINVSANGNNAGSLTITATGNSGGQVMLGGTFLGSSTGNFSSGFFDARVQSLGDFSALNAQLNQGGFFGSRSFDIKQGSVLIAAGTTIKAHTVDISVDNGSLTVSGVIDASGTAPGSIRLSAGGNLELTASAVLDAHGKVLQVDSYGQPIDAKNRATVELTVADGTNSSVATLNNGQGILLLDPGATINLSSPDGVNRGDLELNVPRMTGATSGDIRILAGGPLSIAGAQTIAVNAFWTYAPADANGTIVQSTGANVPAGAVILDQVSQDSTAFIGNAEANGVLNAGLQSKLAGLTAYRQAFHLRPGVEIVSATPNGNLIVQGDLDLSLYRYASVNPSSQLNGAVYGSGEPGVLLFRAGGNLTVNGSITDGFGQVPGPNPDDKGWVLQSGILGANLTLPADLPQAIILKPSSTYPATNVTLNYDLPVATGNVILPGVSLPVTAQPISLSKGVQISSSFIATGTITGPSGQILFRAGQTVPASPAAPYKFAIGTAFGSGSILPFPITINAVMWPAGSSLAAFSQKIRLDPNGTLTLAANDLIPAGANLAFANGPANLRPLNSNGVQGLIYPTAPLLGPGLLSWSFSLVSGADVAAADSRALLATTALNGSGNLLLSDPHIAKKGGQPDFSVIRTGTGSLDLMAGGNLEEQSLYGIYTAGAQSPAILNAGINLYNPTRSPGLSGAYANVVAAQIAGGYQAFYPTGGGNLLVSVGEDLFTYTSALTTSPAVGNWLWRSGGALDPSSGAVLPAAWWINFGTYLAPNGFPASLTGFTGFGTLGGGNLTILVAGSAGIQNAGPGSRSGGSFVPTTSQSLVAAIGATGRINGTSIVETGGGDLTIKIGGALNPVASNFQENDLDGGEFTELRGTLQIKAGSIGGLELLYGRSSPTDPVPTSPFVAAGLTLANSAPIYGNPVVVLGDAVAEFETRGDLALGGVDDAGRVAESVQFQGAWTGHLIVPTNSWFSLWRPQTELDLLSAGGNLAPLSLANLRGDGSNYETNNGYTYRSYFYPSILKFVATDGSVYLGGYYAASTIEQAPSLYSQLEVFAKGSIYANALAADSGNANSGPVTFAISSGTLNSVAAPFKPAFYGLDTLGSPVTNVSTTNSDVVAGLPVDALFVFGLDTAANGLSHFDLPSRIYAGGDIVDSQYGAVLTPRPSGSATETLYLSAGPVQIRAGGNIINFGSPGSQGLILNNSRQDVSVISAGSDILYANVDVAGPGDLEVSAGHNLYQNQAILDQQAVIESIGLLGSARTLNPSGGASVSVMAGVGASGPDFNQFATLYLNPANLADPSIPLQNQPGKVVQTYQNELYAWLKQVYGYTGTETNELAYFDSLSPDQRSVFLLQTYFAELNLSGLEHNDPTSPFFQTYLRGTRAITTLFPGSAASYKGNLTLFGGAGIRTDFGGAIDVLTPDGQTIVGVEGAQPPPTAGILTQGSGDINIYSEGSVLLGQSRILTTFGGNILIWSGTGDINAGIGAKGTVIFTPPGIVYDGFADILLSPTVPSSGAGIGTLDPIPQVPPGNLNLIAPQGTIDAGEAGIRVSGNANLAARVIINAANITVQGHATGLPTIVTPNVAAITAASNTVGAANNVANEIAKQQVAAGTQDIPSIITVEVLGYGGG